MHWTLVIVRIAGYVSELFFLNIFLPVSLNWKGEVPSCYSYYYSRVTLRLPPLDSETGWTGELWSKTNLLNWPDWRALVESRPPNIGKLKG